MTKAEKQQERRLQLADYNYYKQTILTIQVALSWCAYTLYKNPNCRHSEKKAVGQMVKSSDSFLSRIFDVHINRGEGVSKEQISTAQQLIEDDAEFLLEEFMKINAIPVELHKKYSEKNMELIKSLILENNKQKKAANEQERTSEPS